MKHILSLTILLALSAGCTNPVENEQQPALVNDTLTEQQEIARLSEFTKQFETPPQRFIIAGDKASTVKGSKGSIWYIDPADLETISGNPIAAELTVELKELTTVTEFLKNNIQTISNGRLLASGGSYYIGITSGGEEVRLKKGKTVQAELPRITDSDGMSLFFGRRDSMNSMNWAETGRDFEFAYEEPPKTKDTAWFTIDRPVARARPDNAAIDSIISYVDGKPMTEQEKQGSEAYQKANRIYKNIYRAIEIEDLGWINIDKFLKSQLTPLYATISNADSIAYLEMYIVLKPYRSIIQTGFYNGNYNPQSVPLTEARVIIFGYGNEKVYFDKEDLTIADSTVVALTLREATDDDVAAFFD